MLCNNIQLLYYVYFRKPVINKEMNCAAFYVDVNKCTFLDSSNEIVKDNRTEPSSISFIVLFCSEIYVATARFDHRIIPDVQQLQFVCHYKHFYLLDELFVIDHSGIVLEIHFSFSHRL